MRRKASTRELLFSCPRGLAGLRRLQILARVLCGGLLALSSAAQAANPFLDEMRPKKAGSAEETVFAYRFPAPEVRTAAGASTVTVAGLENVGEPEHTIYGKATFGREGNS